ncbi:MAG: MopE-related protein, partial [Bacteroidota bacterium]
MDAQVTINNGDCGLNINIPDNNCVQVAIPMANLPGNQLGQDVFLSEVRLILRHEWRNDLVVSLIAPDGQTEVKLIDERGSSGDDFGIVNGNDCTFPFILSDSECIIDSVKNITSSTDAVGIFKPEERLDNFYLSSLINPNGTWTLKICDDKFNDLGALTHAELVFRPLGCTAPTTLEAFNVTATTIDLGWETNGQCGGNVIVEYGPKGFRPGNGTVAGSTNSQVVVLDCREEFDLINLDELTEYDIYVRQSCSSGLNYFYNSCKATATTDCILPSVTLVENFDNQVGCGATGGNCIDCSTVSGVWKNITTDEIDWIVNNGSTVTSQTGPNGDVNQNGQYLYVESSSTCRPNKEAILQSDCIEVESSTGICHFSFFYHMNGININSLSLEITTDGLNWNTLWSESGSQSEEWLRQYINLSAYDGDVVQFRFRGFSAETGFRGDIGLDEITFYGSQLKASDIFYADADNDGFGNPMDSIAVCFAAQPTGYVSNNTDCDDSNPSINPNATEIPCNGIDENCNGNADDVVVFTPNFTTDTVCSGLTATISATPSNNGQIYWYADATGTMLLDSSTVFITPVLTTSTTYYFQEEQNFTNQICISNIVPVDVVVNAVPNISNASGNQNICQNTNFDLTTLVLQDANNVTDTFLFFQNDSYTANAQIANPVVSISSDSTFYVRAVSENGCTDDLAVSFFKQTTPEINITQGDTLALCFQSDPQLLSVTTTSTNTGALDFNWNTGAQGAEAIVFSRSKDFYQTVEVTAVSPLNGCSATDQIVVHTLPSISSIEVTSIQEPDFCQENGSILLTPRDGQAPFSYAWNGAVSGATNAVSSPNYTIPNLALGAYTITVIDDFGCSKSLPQQVVNGADFGINTITDVSCFGLNDGAITLNVGGLVNPTYEWSDGTTVFSTDQNIAGRGGGIYSVTVDADNVPACQIDSIIIKEPQPLAILNESIRTPSCANESDAAIDLTLTGGTPNSAGSYQFSWTNGLANTNNPQNLAAGNYRVTVSDANNCSLTDTFEILPTAPLSVNLTAIAPECFGQNDGEIQTQVTGGTAPYNFAWNDALGQSTATAFGLPAGTFTLTVIDANNCTETAQSTLANPTALSLSVANISSPICNEINDGEINLSVSGGTGTYSYQWSTGDTTASLTEVGAGIYGITVTDANSCTNHLDSILVTAPDLMNISFTTQQAPLCIGRTDGSVAINVAGGVAPYSYEWSNGATTDILNNLPEESYFVKVTDDNGCIAFSDTAKLIAPQLLSVNNFLVVDSVRCKGD